jgi:hypothetical protein
MRPTALLALLAVPFLSGCDTEAPVAAPIAPPDDVLLQRAPGPGPATLLQNFVAPHSGDQEAPPRDTRARGLASFQLSKDGTALHYQLNVANIENVTQAHIHCGPPGENGPVILWLYPSAPPAQLIPGRFNGVLSQGVATEADVVARPDSEVCPGGVTSLADVVEKMRTGGAYSNVHTQQFPPGEIRGDIHAGGPHT